MFAAYFPVAIPPILPSRMKIPPSFPNHRSDAADHLRHFDHIFLLPFLRFAAIIFH
jgi:hypothetical protein